MAEETQKRKADHIKICLNEKAQARKATTGFEDICFVHKALPELDRQEIDLSTYFLGHKFNAPIMVGAMTGGTAEGEQINSNLSEAVEKLGLGMGVGSQRVAIQNPKLARTFAVARKKAPTAFLIANIGAVQLVHGYGLKEVKSAVEMIDADALAIHLNALQESVQPEGQTNFKGVLEKIAEVAGEIDVPVVVKETGCGIACEEAEMLQEANVKAIEVGGSGGTSFAAVEYYRSKAEGKSMSELFWDWGIPTAASLIEVSESVQVPVVASGGLRSGENIAKALALNASLTSLSQPLLQAAVTSAKEVEETLKFLSEQLRNVMFLVGAKDVQQLTKARMVITGKTAEWISARGLLPECLGERGVV